MRKIKHTTNVIRQIAEADMACHGQKSLSSSFVRLIFRLSCNDLIRWFSWRFRAHIIWKDRVVKYDHVYRQINAAVQKYWENEKWR